MQSQNNKQCHCPKNVAFNPLSINPFLDTSLEMTYPK